MSSSHVTWTITLLIFVFNLPYFVVLHIYACVVTCQLSRGPPRKRPARASVTRRSTRTKPRTHFLNFLFLLQPPATSLLRNMFNTLCQYKIRKTGNGEKYSYTQLLPTFAELSSATPSCESTEQGTDESSSATIVGQSTSLTPVGSIE